MDEMVNLTKYLESLEEFCIGENEKYCTKELMNVAMLYVKEKQKEINQKILDEIEKAKRVERQRKRKNQQVKLMLRQHFLDRHL